MSKARIAPKPGHTSNARCRGIRETATLKAHALGVKACINAIAAFENLAGLSKDDASTVAAALLTYADRRTDDILRELEELKPILAELVARVPKDPEAVA